jgi:hypothetical protein
MEGCDYENVRQKTKEMEKKGKTERPMPRTKREGHGQRSGSRLYIAQFAMRQGRTILLSLGGATKGHTQSV